MRPLLKDSREKEDVLQHLTLNLKERNIPIPPLIFKSQLFLALNKCLKVQQLLLTESIMVALIIQKKEVKVRVAQVVVVVAAVQIVKPKALQYIKMRKAIN